MREEIMGVKVTGQEVKDIKAVEVVTLGLLLKILEQVVVQEEVEDRVVDIVKFTEDRENRKLQDIEVKVITGIVVREKVLKGIQELLGEKDLRLVDIEKILSKVRE